MALLPQLPITEDPRAAGCEHRGELDRLIRELTGINRELSIIVRALMNGARR